MSESCYQCNVEATEAAPAGEGFLDEHIPLCGRHAALLREERTAKERQRQEPQRQQSNWHGSAGNQS